MYLMDDEYSQNLVYNLFCLYRYIILLNHTLLY